MLEIKNIKKTYQDFQLRDVSFVSSQGDYFVLLGESGAGKSVLLEIISGLVHPDKGSVSFNGRDITNDAIGKRNVGLVYQDQALFPHLSVASNIAYPLKCRKLPKSKIHEEVKKLAEKVGVTKLLDRYPETLSVGEAQRVALARTLATEPELLLLDEPLASLDVQAKSGMRSLLRKLNQDGQTIIHVTHDYEEAIALATKLAVIENGTIAQVGIPEDIFQHPESEFIARFTGIKNFYKGALISKDDKLANFVVDNIIFEIVAEEQGGFGCLILRSEDITISKIQPESSARNHFSGTISDIEPVRLGIEIRVDIGVPIVAKITKESLTSMKLEINQPVWINFKASAARYLPE